MRSAVTAAAMLVLILGIANAQMKPQSGMAGGMMSNQMSAMPDMTADQMAKMDAARVAYIQTVGPIMTNLMVSKFQLAALWRADNIDTKAILAKVNEIDALKAKLDVAKANHWIAMWNTLTPDQRKSMRMGMHGMMKKMMMPGMMMQGCPMMGGGMMGSGMMGSGMMGGSMMGDDMMGGGMMGSGEMNESESE